MKTIQNIIQAGRPEDLAFALTYDQSVRRLSEVEKLLAFGVEMDGSIVRSFSWKRWTGRVRLKVGEAKAQYAGVPGKSIPAVIAASLETFGGEPVQAKKMEQVIQNMAYSDVLLMLVDRMLERSAKKGLPVTGVPCMSCGNLITEAVKATHEQVRVSFVDWDPGNSPSAVVWLDDPFTYAGVEIEALVVGHATWRSVFGSARQDDLLNPEYTTIMGATANVIGYVHEGVATGMTIPREVLMDLLSGEDVDAVSQATYQCSGGAEMFATVKHVCGGDTLVPFDWTAAL